MTQKNFMSTSGRLISIALLALLAAAPAQDGNIAYPIADIEQMLWRDSVEVALPRAIRFEGDAAKTAVLKRPDGFFLRIKLKRAAQGGEDYNNQPRYEIAAYELQKLFLSPAEYVVPPTAGRGFPLKQYREKIDDKAQPTFDSSAAVFCTLQYWLDNVTNKNVYDPKRFKEDSLYARHLSNLNIFTYLVRHSDSNIGNFLISKLPANPRVFAVDNGMAFGNITSNRGYEWRSLVLDRFSGDVIERLRKITRADLDAALQTVAQYRIDRNGQLVAIPPTAAFNPEKGVRRADQQIQFGLTEKEIDGVYQRLRELLEKVDSGKIATF